MKYRSIKKDGSLEAPIKVNDDTYSTPSYLPVPGIGVLPITWSLIKAREPVLVDTGMPIDRDEFFQDAEVADRP